MYFSEEGPFSPASAAGVRGRDGHAEEHEGIPHSQTSGLQTDNLQTGNTTQQYTKEGNTHTNTQTHTHTSQPD